MYNNKSINSIMRREGYFREIPLREVREEGELIPCSFCGFNQTFQQLDTHPSQCPHREQQCEYCNQVFPISLLLQHKFFCPTMRAHFLREQEEENQMNEELEIGHHRSNNVRMRERMRNILQGLLQNQGLSQEEINALKRIEYKKRNEEPDLCTVCFSNFEEREEIMILPCHHLFHIECISKWLSNSRVCPVCKQSCQKA